MAERGVAYPLVVFHIIDSRGDYTFGSLAFHTTLVQFSVFSDTLAADEAHQIGREIVTAYKLATLTIASGAAQLAGGLYYNEERCIRDGELWHHSLDFDVRLRAA